MLVTRVVYKMLTEGYDGLILSNRHISPPAPGKPDLPSSYVSPVRRCKLQLPPHDKRAANGATSKSEVDAALRSKEVDCTYKDDFGKLKAGQWYSDTFTFDFGGCSAVTKAKATYDPVIPYVTHNSGPSFLLAKFEVQELW
jgi:hypothetical protein